MLKGINPLLSPELLKILCEMGHGDELVLADANFPSASISQRIIRADGIRANDLLNAVLSVFPLDHYVDDHFVLMEVVKGDPVVPTIWDEYKETLKRYDADAGVTTIERYAFYERSKKAYAVIATGETAQYGNILIKKGVVK